MKCQNLPPPPSPFLPPPPPPVPVLYFGQNMDRTFNGNDSDVDCSIEKHYYYFKCSFKIWNLSWTVSREQRFQIPTPCCEVGVFLSAPGLWKFVSAPARLSAQNVLISKSLWRAVKFQQKKVQHPALYPQKPCSMRLRLRNSGFNLGH